jgi:hypothetical protein
LRPPSSPNNEGDQEQNNYHPAENPRKLHNSVVQNNSRSRFLDRFYGFSRPIS